MPVKLCTVQIMVRGKHQHCNYWNIGNTQSARLYVHVVMCTCIIYVHDIPSYTVV